MGGTVFAGSSIRSRESRILILVSLLQLPESKILNQEHASAAGPFPRPTSPSVSYWLLPQFSLLSTFFTSLPLSYSQQSFTRLAAFHSFSQLPSTFSHVECLKMAKTSDPLTISTSFTLFIGSNKTPYMHQSLNNENREEMVARRCL